MRFVLCSNIYLIHGWQEKHKGTERKSIGSRKTQPLGSFVGVVLGSFV